MDAVVVRGYQRSKIHPVKFALWVGMASITMMFAAMTSAYIVRHAAGNWLEFELPSLFYLSTGIILLSSLTLHGSYLAFNRKKEKVYKALLLISLALGLAFVASQYEAWLQLMATGVELTTNPSGSFVYVISGLHAAHVLGGIAAMVVAVVLAFSLPFVPSPKRKLRLELTATYWHFVDLLWVYLLFFFTYQ